MNQQLVQSARKLRLSGLLSSLEMRLQEASTHALPHAQFLELIFQDELNTRGQRQIDKRRKDAGFRDTKTLEDFDWAFNTGLKRQQIYQLGSCAFVREHRDLLFLGPPGLGKSHLAQAIGLNAIKAGHAVLYRSIFDLVRDFLKDEAFNQQDRVLRRYLKPDLVIIDDMGLKALPKQSGEYLLEEIGRASCRERVSLVV